MTNASDFLSAVQSGDAANAHRMLQANPALASAKDANGVSAVMHAYYRGDHKIAALLAATKDDLDIFEATAAGKIARVLEILRAEPGAAHLRSADGFTALHFAAFFNRPEIARELIQNGAEVAAIASNAMKVTPLHSAAAARSRGIVNLLLEHGADANARQHGGWTALHAAAQNGDVEMTRDLLAYGADSQAANDNGKTPAQIAQAKGHGELAQALLSSLPVRQE